MLPEQEMSSKPKPLLVFGYGNLSRGDDALGPLLLEHIEKHPPSVSADVEILCDFQLQIEHALDLESRELVLFVDASVADIEAFDFMELAPARDDSYSTHAMSPQAVMAVYQTIKKQPLPPCFLLSIKGGQFELGESLSVMAEKNLALACQFVGQLLAMPKPHIWKSFVQHKPCGQISA